MGREGGREGGRPAGREARRSEREREREWRKGGAVYHGVLPPPILTTPFLTGEHAVELLIQVFYSLSQLVPAKICSLVPKAWERG